MGDDVAKLFDDAPVLPPLATAPDDVPEPGDRRTTMERAGVPLRLPDDCPVKALGYDGTQRIYLDARRQLVTLAAHEHGNLHISGLFHGAVDYLESRWPARKEVVVGKDGNGKAIKELIIIGHRPEWVKNALMLSCSERGLVSLQDRERHGGAWRSRDGGLVLHCGDAIWKAGEWQEPDLIDGYIYPACAALPRPAAYDADAGLARELLGHLQCWHWRRPEVDPLLALAWIGCAPFGGALAWRPAIWITGDAATGKSTLQEWLKELLHDQLLHCADTSESGITQTLGKSSLPVALDESEPEVDSAKMRNLVKLMRIMASGGKKRRGGADHKAKEFEARSCMLFSSILVPPLYAQDVTRLGILELQQLTKEHRAPLLDPKWCRATGAVLRARVLKQWHRWPETLMIYIIDLMARGHNGRSADQFGTLLAMADLMLHDRLLCEDARAELCNHLAASKLAEVSDSSSDHQKCADALMLAVVDTGRSSDRRAISGIVADICKNLGTIAGEDDVKRWQKWLALHGMRVLRRPWMHPDLKREVQTDWLFCAKAHRGLDALFQGSHWQGFAGTTRPYIQALKRSPDCIEKATVRIDGKATDGILLRVDRIMSVGRDGEEVME
jgi:hypothetical protein